MEPIKTSTAPNPVTNLSVETQTESSITLIWDEPGHDKVNLTYWIQWLGKNDSNGLTNTTNTSVMVDNLAPASTYEFFVWVEKNEISSTMETLNASTAPNPVTNLSVETQTESSITLIWDEPGHDTVNLTYWIQWLGKNDSNGLTSTTNTSVMVDNLAPASTYEFFVWVEKNEINSTMETLNASTAPNPVTNLSVETQTESSITLIWDEPGHDKVNLTYWIQWLGKNDSNGLTSTTNTSVMVDNLAPASTYEFFVWVEKNEINSTMETLNASTAPNPVTNLSVETQTESSITLIWDEPGHDKVNLTYWIQWLGKNDSNGLTSTTNTSVMVDNLAPASTYEFFVWVEKNEINSTMETLNASTAPNPVTNLSVETQTESSITLIWDEPGHDKVNLTYWIQWLGKNDSNGLTSTTNTSVMVDNLAPASTYEFFVWVEKNEINSTMETLNASTAPNPVTNLSVETQTESSITLIWDEPGHDKVNLTYWIQWLGKNDSNGLTSTTNTSVMVDNLAPASTYEFFVWVEKNEINSTMETLNASTAPNPVTNLSVETQTDSSITLIWDEPGHDKVNLTYWIQWLGKNDINGLTSTTNTSVMVDNLAPASTYEFFVWVEKGDINSTMETLNASTAPNPVINLRVEAQTNNSITLSWDEPEGHDPSNLTYWIKWLGEDYSNEPKSTTSTSFVVNSLAPASTYEFFVWVEKNEINSTTETLNASTAPNPVRNLSVETQNNSSITLSWDKPEGHDPSNLTYWIRCFGEDYSNVSKSTTNTSFVVDSLAPASTYEFFVWVEKNEINSTMETLNASTAPNPVRNLSVETQTTSSITLSWDEPDGRNDTVNLTYWVQWPGDDGNNKNKSTTNTSVVVDNLAPGSTYEFSVWVEYNGIRSIVVTINASTVPAAVSELSCVSTSGGYGVILTWPCPSGGYDTFEVKVGGQQRNQSSCGTGMAVSDLGPAQSYTATITTVSHGLRASLFSVTCHTESTGVIVGAIVGILLLFILLGLLIFFLKRRRKRSQQKKTPKDLVFSVPGDILAKDFADHVRVKEKDSNYGFAEEYQQLAPEGQGQSQTTALAPENTSKNRYRNVLPYDWSRVPLKPLHEEPGSDYINANFMPGLWSSKEFIATQGPLPHTVGDFWRLVWEQKSHTLVMLTNCMESGRVKCEHYWPLDAQPCTHGQLQVTLMSEEVKENWTVRDLQLFHVGEQQTHSVRQFHFLAWPDHGVPYSPDPLLDFQKVLREWVDQSMDGGPPIVHCSAGVGRTGTLIALDVLLRQLECEGLVGPFSFVKKMRESRPLMVQTEAQYIFLHQCILRFLQKSAPSLILKESIYENVPNFIYENVAAIRPHESEVSATGC